MEVAYRLSQEEGKGGKKTEKLVFCWGLLMRSAVVGVALLGPPSHRPNEEGSLWDLPGRLGAWLLWGLAGKGGRGRGDRDGCQPVVQSQPFQTIYKDVRNTSGGGKN